MFVQESAHREPIVGLGSEASLNLKKKLQGVTLLNITRMGLSYISQYR